MSKSKLEILNELKQYVDERKIIHYDYIQVKESGYVSYDSLGFIANQIGIEDDVLLELHGDSIDSAHVGTKEFAENLIEAGFSLDELAELQILNDSSPVEELLEYINVLIEEL
jgi:hypothetical protein